MSLKITKASDPMPVKQLVVMVYAQPGSGKTSMGGTASKPLTLDFDHGAYRSAFRPDTLEVDHWSDVSTLPPDELVDYDTIVVDTVGRALDKIQSHIIATDPKKANAAGSLTLQGFGDLKTTFIAWIKQLRELGKDIVLLAHDAEDKQGDNLIVRPDATGGSKNELVKVADAIGYMYRADKRTIVDFNPSDRWIGKNCAGFEPMSVPDFAAAPSFLADVIQSAKDKLNEQTEAQREAANALADWQVRIQEATTADELTSLIGDAKQAPDAVRDNVGKLMSQQAKAIGAKFDRDSGEYVAKEAA